MLFVIQKAILDWKYLDVYKTKHFAIKKKNQNYRVFFHVIRTTFANQTFSQNNLHTREKLYEKEMEKTKCDRYQLTVTLEK